MSTRTVTAHIPLDLAEQLDASAARHDRPRGWVIKQALQNWISLEEKRHQMTLKGFAMLPKGGCMTRRKSMPGSTGLNERPANAMVIGSAP